jgi:hypothetical protein
VRNLILDTNILILHWRQSRPRDLEQCSTADAASWALELIRIHQTDAIVTPVYLEFVGGVVHRHEMGLAKAYLERFRVLDDGGITEDDLSLARQIAERIAPGPEPTRRGAVDCLIKAIARRFRCEVRTCDLGMPR